MLLDALNQSNQSLRDDLKAIGVSDAVLSGASASAIPALADLTIGQESWDHQIRKQWDVKDIRVDVYFSEDVRFTFRCNNAHLCLYNDSAYQLCHCKGISLDGDLVDYIRLREYLRNRDGVSWSFASCVDEEKNRRITFRNSAIVAFFFSDENEVCLGREIVPDIFNDKMVDFDDMYGYGSSKD